MKLIYTNVILTIKLLIQTKMDLVDSILNVIYIIMNYYRFMKITSYKIIIYE